MSITLQETISQLYTKAVIEGSSTSTLRLDTLASYCIEQLAGRGLEGGEIDVDIPGGGRTKKWDVAWEFEGKYRLAISLKSILQNLAGTVPNRVDDLIGEVANLQMYSPEIVVGYLMIFDVSKDNVSRKHGVTWCQLLRERLERVSGRSPPAWGMGMIESFTIVEVDFSQSARLITSEENVLSMFDFLAQEVKRRNPSIDIG